MIIISQSAISEFKDFNQHDTFKLIGGIQQIESMNSSYNDIASCPLITAERSTMCTFRMMVAVSNKPYQGLSYFLREDSNFNMCSFINNEFSYEGMIHGIFSLSMANIRVNKCDFVKNSGLVLLLSYGSSALIEGCLFEGNPVPSNVNVTIKNQILSANVVDNWVMTPECCHIHIIYSMKLRYKLATVVLAFLLLDSSLSLSLLINK